MFGRYATAAAAVITLLGAAGCASTEDVRAMRRSPLPPRHVVLADSNQALSQSVYLYEITGAPEFFLFDGGGLYTTRPTRARVADHFSAWLSEADMLAPSMAHADYLLSVHFEQLRGPNVWWFTDKTARATATFVITDIRTGAEMSRATVDTDFRARMPGVTEEMVRAGITGALFGGLVGVAIADADPLDGEMMVFGAVAAAAGGGALAVDAAAHDRLLWDWPTAGVEALAATSAGRGFFWGLAGGAAAANSDGARGLSDTEGFGIGAVAGGATGFFAAAPSGFDGTERRHHAVEGMLRRSFAGFLDDLIDRGMISRRRAVPCLELNPDGIGSAYLIKTRDAVGYDCPARDVPEPPSTIGRVRGLLSLR